MHYMECKCHFPLHSIIALKSVHPSGGPVWFSGKSSLDCNQGSWVQATLDPLVCFMGVSLGKTP